MKEGINSYQHLPVIGLMLGVAIGFTLWSIEPFLPTPRRMTLALLAILMFYHFEQHYFPGGFNYWMNKTVFSSRVADSPLNQKRSNCIDIIIMWGLTALAILIAPHSFLLGLVALFVSLNRAWFHLTNVVMSSQYSPGSFVSILILIPFCSYVCYVALKFNWANWLEVILTAVIGTLVHALQFLILRRLGKADRKRGLAILSRE